MVRNINPRLSTLALTFAFVLTLFSFQAPVSAQDAAERADIQEFLRDRDRLTPTPLDFSNPLHYRIYLRQLHLAGITPDKYPQQHKMLEEAKRRHIAAAAGPANAPDPAIVASLCACGTAGPLPEIDVGNSEQTIHTITSLGFDPNNRSNYTTSALTSIPGSPPQATMMLALYDNNSARIGNVTSTQTFGQAANMDASATGVRPAAATDVQSLALYSWTDSTGAPHHATSSALVSSGTPTSITCDAPRPKSGQNICGICLGRAGDFCSYYPVDGTADNVLVPVKGNITFSSAIDATQTKNAYIALANTDAGAGGGCLIASSSDFFADPNTKIDGATLSWDLTAKFGTHGCLKANSKAVFTFQTSVTLANGFGYASITNDPRSSADGNTLKIEETWIYFSCLAEGTEVLMADGSHKTIETIQPNDQVTTNAAGKTMHVDSLLKGLEKAPCLRLETNLGNKVLMTGGHPVMTPDGPTLARLLKVGDEVITEEGTATLTVIELEDYDGMVWNLNMGPPPEDMSKRYDKHTFFANGFLVGDNQMQYHENRRHQNKRESVLASIPEEWHQDYLNFLKDQQATNQK